MSNNFIEGERVNLRGIEEEDASFIKENINDSEIRLFVDHRGPTTSRKEEDFIREVNTDESRFSFIIMYEGERVGFIELKTLLAESRLGEIEIWIAPEYQGEGIGKESSEIIVDFGFNRLNFHKIIARLHSSNKSSENIWQELGFNREGRMEKALILDGKWVDALTYGILREDWE
jgi:RimJ/RimL family protein N-acetyltransferase